VLEHFKIIFPKENFVKEIIMAKEQAENKNKLQVGLLTACKTWHNHNHNCHAKICLFI